MDGVATTTADLAAMVGALSSMSEPVDDADRIERIRQFEQIKSVAAAAQAAETAAFAVSQRTAQASAGEPLERQSRGVAAQVALARRISPFAATRYVGWASILVRELPATFAELKAGRTSEWRAMLVARETIFLSREDRAVVDSELAPELERLSDRAVETQTRKAAYRLDPEGFLARSRAAANDRNVGIRPAPDTMCRLTGLLPVAQGVAAYAALVKAADFCRSTGDPRSRGQVMADTFVERLTGQAHADAVPVEVELFMSTDTLLGGAGGTAGGARAPHGANAAEDGTDRTADDTSETSSDCAFGMSSDRASETTGDHASETAADRASEATPAGTCGNDVMSEGLADEPAFITAPGLTPMPVPAGLARDLVADAPRAWLRRLFTEPCTGSLVSMETRSRLFTKSQRRFLRYRDQFCATPWCGAPIRHADHVTAAVDGGATHLVNGRGFCEACNYAVQAPGWRSRSRPDGTEMITPTGHRYTQQRPAPPGSPPFRRRSNVVEHILADDRYGRDDRKDEGRDDIEYAEYIDFVA